MKRLFKKLAIGILTLVLLFCGFLFISGNTYVFFLLKHTVFKGRLGPSIDEYQIYENRTVVASNPTPWPRAESYNKGKLDEQALEYHKKYGSAAFVVIKDGKLLFEKYWDGYADSSHTNSWSMAKSIVSHLVGCAIKDGKIKSVKEPIGIYLDQYATSKITIENLLTMSSGINFDEDYLNPFGYPARSLYGNDILSVHQKYRAVKQPGVNFDYQSANTQLLGFILMKATGKSLSDYAAEKLWNPIGAQHNAYWSLDHKNGIEKAYCCFNSNALDFAKFGQLYLQKGVINSDTLIPLDYFIQGTNADTTLMDGALKNQRYGYQWWLVEIDGEDVLYARGIQGQYIFILPKSNLVIVRLGHLRPTIRINGHPEDVYKYIENGKILANY